VDLDMFLILRRVLEELEPGRRGRPRIPGENGCDEV